MKTYDEFEFCAGQTLEETTPEKHMTLWFTSTNFVTRIFFHSQPMHTGGPHLNVLNS